MRDKVRNLGFSLVELIVAFAILGVATLGVGSFFIAATRNSSKTHEQSGLYNETQLASNQMESMIQEAELALSYRSGGAFVLKDTNADATEKVLYIFNASATGKAELVLLKWDQNTKEITYAELTDAEMKALDTTAVEGGRQDVNIAGVDLTSSSINWSLVAEDVETFSVRIDEDHHKVFVDTKFGDGSTYNSSQTITLRNKVLFNPDTLSKVTEKITVNVESEITEVKINVSPKILAPGASAHVDCDVFGSGVLPSYTTKWTVAKDFAMSKIVGDSSVADSLVKVDTNGVMSVVFNDDLNAHTGALYVQATVISDEQVVKSNIEEFKIIRDMSVTVDDSQVFSSLTNPLTNHYQVSNGLKYQMKASILGNSLSVYEQNVNWSLDDVAAGVNATISEDGVLEIANYSYGGSLKVVATLVKNPTIKVVFPLNVRGTHASGDGLLLVPTTQSSTINRGGEVGFKVSVKSNITNYDGLEVDPEDCNWSVSVSPAVAEDLVTIGTSGVVTVKKDLPYGSAYTINVTASLKKDSNVTYTVPITVPKVSVVIDRNTITNLKRGNSLDLPCTVTGLEEYQLDWSMARSLKPTYFFGVLGNTSVSAMENEGVNFGRVVFSGDEPAEVTSVKVQAELVGNPVYKDSVEIPTLADVKVSLVQDGKGIAIDSEGKGIMNKNKRKSFWGYSYEEEHPVYISIQVENGDSSKISWSATGDGVKKSNSSFQILSSGKGPATVKVSYNGVPQLDKTFILTIN